MEMAGKAFLVLENGMTFEGKFFGAEQQVSGELVFTTEMVGYLETSTDPNYHGQIVLQTFPLIGNYGVIEDDFLSDAGPSAYIVKYPCQDPSNFRSEGSLDTFLKRRNITGLYDVDTRAIAKIVRDNGTIYGMIACGVQGEPPGFVGGKADNLVAAVSTKEVTMFKAEGSSKGTVVIIDFGLNVRLKNQLLQRGYDVAVFPYNTAPNVILAKSCVGIILSDGPGDPTDNKQVIANIKSLLSSKIPMLGVGLGHQLLALANGFRTEKLKGGHRGANQGVKCILSGKVHTTRQNHGYAVVSTSINKKIAIESYINVNDKTCEGIEYKATPSFSVQFDIEGKMFVFDKFEKVISGGNQ